MVEVALYQRFCTIHMSILPCCILTHLVISITVAVGFLVGFIHDVHAPAVAEFIEVLPVGIVRGTQEIDVGLLHQRDVLLVGGIVDIAARYRMVVVTIHAAQLHVLAVDLEYLAYALHTFYAQMVVEVLSPLHTPPLRGGFQFDGVWVEIRFLGRPQLRVIDKVCQTNCCSIANRKAFQLSLNGFSVDIQADVHVLGLLLAHIANGDIGSNGSFCKVLVRHCRYMIVGDMDQGAYPEFYATEDA